MLSQIARTVIRSAPRRVGTRSSSYGHSDFKFATMDELPVPQGCWQKNYNEKQKLYNIQLAAGIISFVGTIAFIVKSEKMFFNAFAPEISKDFVRIR